MMCSAVPFVSANPISVLQETISPTANVQPVPVAQQHNAMRETAPALFGIASWYSEADPWINRHTASGEIFDDTKLTCASWDFPFGTRLKITNLSNGKSVICIVNDCGPAKRLGRSVDLTKAAFRKIADPRLGLVKVSVTPLSAGKLP